MPRSGCSALHGVNPNLKKCQNVIYLLIPWKILLEQKKPSYFSQIDLLPWIWYKRQLGQILVSELATIFQKIYTVCLGISKCSKKIQRNMTYINQFLVAISIRCMHLYVFIRPSYAFPNDYLRLAKPLLLPFFIPGNNKYYTTILINSSYPSGYDLLMLRVTLLW